MSNDIDMPRHKTAKRWLRFSLRTLLVLIIICSLGFGWLNMKIRRAHIERSVAEALEARGADVRTRDYVLPKWLRSWLDNKTQFVEEIAAHGYNFDRVMHEKSDAVRNIENLLGQNRRHSNDQNVRERLLEELDRARRAEQKLLDTLQQTDDVLRYAGQLKRLRSLSLSKTNFNSQSLSEISNASKLDLLNLENTQVSDAGIEHLSDLNALTWLNLSGTNVTDSGMRHLSNLRELTHLLLSDTEVTDAGLAHIDNLTNMTMLDISNTKGATDNGLVHLRKMVGMDVLDLWNTDVGDSGLANLQRMKKLRVLWLGGTQVTDAGLKHVAKLKNLEFLYMYEMQVTDAGLQYLGQLKKLKDLELGGLEIHGDGLRHLRNLKTLTRLGLERTVTGNSALVYLGKLPALDSLHLGMTEVTDDGIESLSALTGLKHLTLTRPNMTKDGCNTLRQRLPACEITLNDWTPLSRELESLELPSLAAGASSQLTVTRAFGGKARCYEISCDENACFYLVHVPGDHKVGFSNLYIVNNPNVRSVSRTQRLARRDQTVVGQIVRHVLSHYSPTLPPIRAELATKFDDQFVDDLVTLWNQYRILADLSGADVKDRKSSQKVSDPQDIFGELPMSRKMK